MTELPPERDPFFCPICGEDCDELYLDNYGEIVGCDNCIREISVYDYKEENKE